MPQHNSLRCTVCNAALPLAKTAGTTWIMGLLGAGIAGAKTRSVPATIAIGLLSAGVGWVVGRLIDEAAEPICGGCSTRLRAA